jgi:hypothetical protein
VAAFLEPFLSFVSSSISSAEYELRCRRAFTPGATAGIQRYSLIEMKRSRSKSSLASEFDNFLLAPIGDDNNGMQLSVLSALARLNVDPWEQAATLALLPADAATRKLAGMIAALPPGPTARAESTIIAARLIPLLPGRVRSEVLSGSTAPDAATAPRLPKLTYLILYALFMLLMLAVQWLSVRPQASTQLNSTPSQAAHTVPPQSPPPGSAH